VADSLLAKACARYVAARFKEKEGVDIALHPLAFRLITDACAEIMPELLAYGRANVVLPCIIREPDRYLHLDVMVFLDEIERRGGG
jgi:hypothetical protein